MLIHVHYTKTRDNFLCMEHIIMHASWFTQRTNEMLMLGSKTRLVHSLTAQNHRYMKRKREKSELLQYTLESACARARVCVCMCEHCMEKSMRKSYEFLSLSFYSCSCALLYVMLFHVIYLNNTYSFGALEK